MTLNTFKEKAMALGLTERRARVCSLIALGRKDRAIALQMKISKATVRTHITRIFGKLGANDRANLVWLIASALPAAAASDTGSSDEEGRDDGAEA